MKKKKQASVENVMEILVETFKPQDGYILCLKSLPANLKAYEGFQWPEIGHVIAPDWKPIEDCGNGLHAFRWGAGDADLACSDTDAKWLVLLVKEEGIINLSGKVKFEECEVVYCGARDIAVSIIQAHAPAGTAIMYSTVSGGDGSTVSGGYGSTVSGGYGSTVSGGPRSTVSGGDGSTVSGGSRSTVSGGYGSTVSGGYGSTVSGGSRSTVSGGDGSTVSGGDGSTVSGGDGSTVSGGYGSTVSGQLWSILIVEYWDSNDEVYKKKAGLVDRVNFLPGMKYKLNDEFEFVTVNDTEA